MPSLRARLVNASLRLSTKSMWKTDLDITRIRRHAAKMDARIARKALPVASEQVEIEGVKATWYGEPGLALRGTILYLHGGAWCLHFPGVFSRHASRLSLLTGMRVLLPDYRLAPEHPFPAGPDDCLTAYRWLIAGGYGARPLVVAGDSAGGNLTLVTLMRARDAMLPMPDCAVLLSPATDLTSSGPSWMYNNDADPMFTFAARDMVRPIYCPDQDIANPMLSPLFGNWAGLPPLLFHAGSTEVLLDDSVRAQDRALQAGVQAEIEVWDQMPHVFHVFSWLPEAKVAMRRIAEFIAARTVRAPAAGEDAAIAHDATAAADGTAAAAAAAPPAIEPVVSAGAAGA